MSNSCHYLLECECSCQLYHRASIAVFSSCLTQMLILWKFYCKQILKPSLHEKIFHDDLFLITSKALICAVWLTKPIFFPWYNEFAHKLKKRETWSALWFWIVYDHVLLTKECFNVMDMVLMDAQVRIITFSRVSEYKISSGK